MENSRPLAVVGAKTITEQDVSEVIAGMGPRAGSYNTPQGRAAVLEQLIGQALFLTDAKKNMLEYDPAFKQQLARVKDDLLVQFAIARALERVKVTEDEIKKFYDENPDQFKGEETVTASHILVDTEEKANEIRQQLESGKITFEDAAKQYSSCPSAQNGGSLGEFGRGQMVPEFDAACFEMQPGELRGPVQTQFGYHLIRLDAKNAARPVSFAEAHDAIEQHLLAEKQRQTYQSRINQLKILYPVQKM